MATTSKSWIYEQPETILGSVGLLALIREEMADRHLAGHRPQIEDYLTVPGFQRLSDAELIELIHYEFTLYRRAGQPVTVDQYRTRFPRFADQLDKSLPRTEECESLMPVTQVDLCLDQTPMPPPKDLAQVPGYEILDTLGQGGMGVVYKARQLGLNRIVALKMVLAGRYANADDKARFRVEAESVAALQHPNIVQVYDIGEHEGAPFFSLEYVDGGTLADRIEAQPQDPEFAAGILVQLARAIQAAHEQNIIHRDLKPANILITVGSNSDPALGSSRSATVSGPSTASSTSHKLPILVPKITDFGLAKRLNTDDRLTLSGVIAGTPHYMSPEQVTGLRGSIGPWVDIYALGVILYEMLTGRPPFLAPNQAETLHRVVHEVPTSPRVSQPRVPRDLETICLKCLEKSPLRRYASAADLADDLTRFLNHEPIVARPISPLERSWRWCRRNPRVACSLGSTFFVFLVGTLVSTYFAIQSAKHAEQFRQQTLAAENFSLQAITAKLQTEEKALAALASETRARSAEQKANHARIQEVQLKQAAVNQEAQRSRELYAATMVLAHKAWDDGNLTKLDQSLARTVPATQTQIDPRNFEWYYLDSIRSVQFFMYPFPYGSHGLISSPDGRITLWSGFEDSVIRIGSEEEVFIPTRGRGSQIVRGAFTTNNKLVATVTEAGRLDIRDVVTGQIVKTLPWDSDQITTLEFSPDGSLLVVGGGSGLEYGPGLIQFWRTADWSPARENLRFPSLVQSLSFCPDGTKLVLATLGEPVAMLDPQTGKQTTLEDQLVARWVATSRSLPVVACADRVRPEIHIVHRDRGERLRTLRGMYGTLGPMALSPDGRHLACVSHDQSIWVWNIDTGELLHRYRHHRSPVRGVAFEPGRNLLYTSSEDSKHLGWKLSNSSDYGTITPKWSYTIRNLLPSTGYYDTPCVHTWGQVGMLDNGNLEWKAVTRTTPKLNQVSSVLLPSTQEVLCVSLEGQSIATSLKTGKVRPFPWIGLAPEPVQLVATPDASRLATQHRDGSVQVHRLDGSHPPKTWKVDPLLILVALRPDGKQLATLSRSNMLVFFDADTGRQQFQHALPGLVYGHLAYSPDGQTLAVAGLVNETLVLVDTATGQTRHTLIGMPREARGVQFSPDGKRLAVWADRRITLYDLETRMETITLQAPESVECVQFTRDGAALVSTDGRQVRVWDGRPAVFHEKVLELNRRFQTDSIIWHQPPQANQPLAFQLSVRNTSEEAYAALPPGRIPFPPSLDVHLQVQRYVAPRWMSNLTTDYFHENLSLPVTQTVPAGGRYDQVLVTAQVVMKPGRYVLSLRLNHTKHGGLPESTMDFEIPVPNRQK